MEQADIVKLSGFLRVRLLDPKGRELRRMEKPNLVCVGAKQAIARLLSQETTPDDYEETKIWSIHVGTDSTPPVVGDTALGTDVFQKECDHPYSVDLGLGEVEVQMTIETGEANGNTLVEAGLFTRGDADDPTSAAGQLMMARQVHGSISKTSSFSIEYTWKFRITS